MKRFLLAFFLLALVSYGASGQITVFSDDFSTNQSTTYTTSGAIGASAWSVSSGGTAGQDFGARRNTSPAQLELTNDATAAANQNGWGFAYAATSTFTAPFNPVLSSNTGLVTWTFNMRQIRADPAGFNTTSSYGAAFILGSTSSTPNTAGSGYAVVLGNTGGTDPIRLSKFTGGITALGTTAPPSANDIIVSNTAGLTDFGTEYLSVKVTYDPTTNTWELFLRNDGGAFVDPATGSLTSQGTAVDATYTGSSLDYIGGYWQGSTGATQTAFFDNVLVTVTLSNTIVTTSVVPTTPPFTLANCAATATGTVFFTATGTYNAGNVYTAYLSDDIGSFTSATNVGTLSSTSNGALSMSITIPAGTVSGTLYQIRVVSSNPVVTGTPTASFSITQAGFCASSHTDYYRSITTGDWDDVTTWESSPDNSTWITPATLAPTFNANTILIRSGHNVTIATTESADQLTIQSGATLTHSGGSAFTLNNNVSGTDMTINSGGTYILNGTQPTGTGTVDVLNGGLVRVESNSAPNESDDFAYGNANVTFRTGSVFEWATNLFTPQWSGRIYFSPTESPTFRFSQTPNFSLGGGTLTIIYGYLEANADLTLQGAGTKTFTNGIIGTAKVDASGSTGNIIINGNTAQLAGDTLKVPSSGLLQIGLGNASGTTVTMTSSKIIIGDVQFSVGNSYIVAGSNNLTVSSTIAGYGSNAYVQTNGTGYLKMNAIGGTRVLPIGASTFNPVYINNGNLADYSARVEDGINPGVAFPTYGINRTWNIFASVANSVEVTFWYYAANANAGVTSPMPQPMEILRYTGSAWSITPGNTSINPTGSDPYLVTTPVAGYISMGTSATPFALGKSGGWILPIDCIISTRAQKRNNTGIISWTVNSCAEVTSFEVQRSIGNGAYQTIGTINPQVNQTDFSFTDPSLAKGTNLYRIKVNRLSGSGKYSNTVALLYDSDVVLVTSLAPNPVQGIATITLSAAHPGSAGLQIYDMSGNLVKKWTSDFAEGNNTIEINVSGLPAGVYHVLVSTAYSKTVTRFIKQ